MSGNTAGMGRIINNFGDALSGTPWEWSAALAAPTGPGNAGKIVAAGDSDAFLLARYNPDGTLDTSFGGNNTGFNKQRFDQLNPEWQLTGQCSDAIAQADGKLVLAGSVYGPSTGYDFAVARFNADGTVDATFGNTGAAATDFGPGTDARANALAIDPGTGAITLAGFAGGDLAIARYTATGAPDTTFGNGTGKLTIDLGATADIAYGVTLQPADGKILVTGRSGSDLVVARFNSNGTPDTSFNLTGRRLLDIGGPGDFGYEVAVDPLGRILAAGEAGGHVLLVRLTDYGLPDTTFGGGDGILQDAALAGYWWGVSFQADGRLLVGGGGTDNTPAALPALILGRYLDDGTPDPTFGEGGRVISATGLSRTEVHALGVLDPGEGKISVAGMTLSATGMYDFLIAQYLPENGALIAPAAPSDLTASVFSDTQIDVTYTDNSSDEEGFILEASTDGENFFPVGYADADETSASAEGLDPSTVYWLRVRAENDGVESEPSPAVKTRTAVDGTLATTPVGSYLITASGTYEYPDQPPVFPTLEDDVRYRLTVSGGCSSGSDRANLDQVFAGDAEYIWRMDSLGGGMGPEDIYESINIGLRVSGVEGSTFWGFYNPYYGLYSVDVIGTGDELAAVYQGLAGADLQGQFTLTIDRLSSAWIVAQDSVGGEANEDALTFEVHRSFTGAAEDVTFDLAGEASEGSDYTLTLSSGSGHTVHFESGQSVATITLTPLDDSTPEWTKDIVITLAGVPAQPDGTGTETGGEIVGDDLGLAIEGPEDSEAGHILFVNNNDDDGNDVPDFLDAVASADDPDLIPMHLTVPADEKAGATVTLSLDSAAVRVWDSPAKHGFSHMVVDAGSPTYTWVIGEQVVPDTLWVEVIEPSLALRDVSMTILASDAPARQPPKNPTTTQATTRATGAKVAIREGLVDVTGRKPEKVYSGQNIFLQGEVLPAALDTVTYAWDVPGKAAFDYQIAPDGKATSIIPLSGEWITRQYVSIHWIDGGEHRAVKLNATVGGVTVSRDTTFDVVRPDVHVTCVTQDAFTVTPDNGRVRIEWGNQGNPGQWYGIRFSQPAFPVDKYPGETCWVQLIEREITRVKDDGTWYVQDVQPIPPNIPPNIDASFPYSAAQDAVDIPGTNFAWDLVEELQTTMYAKMILMYRPVKRGGSDSIWIPLRQVNWYMFYEAANTSGTPDGWEILNRGFANDPPDSELVELPEWWRSIQEAAPAYDPNNHPTYIEEM